MIHYIDTFLANGGSNPVRYGSSIVQIIPRNNCRKFTLAERRVSSEAYDGCPYVNDCESLINVKYNIVERNEI